MNLNAQADEIYQLIKHQIKSGLYQTHQKLPSIRSLCSRYSISKNTAISIMDVLIDDGLIYSKPASGFYVMKKEPVLSGRGSIELQDVDELWLMRRQLENFKDLVNLGDGFPASEWFDLLPLNKLIQQSVAQNSNKLLRYGSKLGSTALRETLAMRLSHLNIHITPEQILLTNGVNDAVDLIIRNLITADSEVLVDSPTYYPLLKKLQLTGCSINEVPRLIYGPDCQILEEILIKKRPKIFFTQSINHNPTGTNISAQNMHNINLLCERHQCLVIENDIFSDYSDLKMRLSSGSGFHNHLYVGGFSKIISPSIRVGYIVGQSALINQLADFKVILHVNSSEYAEQIIHTILNSKHYGRHLEYFKDKLQAASTQALHNIQAVGGNPFIFNPQSLYIWTEFKPLKFDTNTIAKAIEHNLVLAPGHIFSQRQQHYHQYIRINVHNAAQAEFVTNFEKLLQQ